MKKRLFVLVMAAMCMIFLSACEKNENDQSRESALIIGKLSGSWSINGFERTGEFTISTEDDITFDENTQRQSGYILLFDENGSFRSECNLAANGFFVGEALNFKQYDEWEFLEVNENNGTLSGRLELRPVNEQYNYTMAVSEDDILTLTATEESLKLFTFSADGSEGENRELLSTYTLTLVRTPGSVS